MICEKVNKNYCDTDEKMSVITIEITPAEAGIKNLGKPTEKADQSSLLRVQDDMEGKIADHNTNNLEKNDNDERIADHSNKGHGGSRGRCRDMDRRR